jgi:hypothetical protein
MGTVTVPISISPPRDRVDELALELAQILTLDDQPTRDYPIPAQLESLTEYLTDAYEAFEEASRDSETTILPAAEWVLDNYYVIEQALQQIKMGMPADYYRRLPKASLSGSKKLARSYILSKALIQSTQSRFEVGTIKDFVQSYQNILPLKIGEIWALPIMLRLCVLEMLASSLANIRQIPSLQPTRKLCSISMAVPALRVIPRPRCRTITSSPTASSVCECWPHKTGRHSLIRSAS